jgi:hypothetical protein
MKKYSLAFLLFFVINIQAQNKPWTVGLNFSAIRNNSTYIGGMSEAHARFDQNNFATGSLNILFQKQYSQNWFLQTGFGFTEIGFESVISNNYSFYNLENRFTALRTSISVIELPLNVIYKFNSDCKNKRWYLGLGAKWVFNGESTNVTKPDKKSINEDLPKVSNDANLVQHVNANTISTITTNFIVGREKLRKNGHIIGLGFIYNQGYNSIAKADVSYLLDGISYTHTFSNKGSYCGLYFQYFFNPIKSKKLLN